MYYVLHKPHGSDKPWQEKPTGYRKRDQALGEFEYLIAKKNDDGSRALDVKLCVGKGRDRRTILKYEEG